MQSILPVRVSILSALLAAAWSAGAIAGEGDLLTLNASAGYTYDNNVFRLESNHKPRDASGQEYSQRGDSIWFVKAGVDANKIVGRQRFYGNLTATDSTYQEFSFLNNDSYQGTVGYRLGFGSDSEVGVYYNNSNRLSNYADYAGFYRRNMISSDRVGGDVMLRVAGAWQGVGSVSYGHDKNSAQDLSRGDSEVLAGDLGVRYAPRGRQNYVDFRMRESQIDYKGSPDVANSPNYDYRQDEARLSAFWTPNTVSNVDSGVSWVQSRHSVLQSQDFSGWAGYLGYTWRPTLATSTGLRLSRDVGPVGDLYGSYARTTGLALTQGWQTTSKLRFDGDLAYMHRKYSGYQNFGAVTPEVNQRRDKILTAGVASSYAVTEKLLVRLSVRDERRLSSVSAYSYNDVITMLSGQYKF